MANEITLSGSLRVVNGPKGIDLELSRSGLQLTMTGDSALQFYQTVGTTEEALELGQDIGTPGFVLIRNLDDTNYVSLRRATGEGNCLKIRAGAFALFELEATAPFVIANSAAVRIEVLLIEV